MKKILTILTIATIAIAFVSCSRGEVKKMPSKMTESFDFSFLDYDVEDVEDVIYEYFYDEQNRLVKITHTGQSDVNIFYNSDGLPEKVEGLWWVEIPNVDIIYQDNGKKIILGIDTIWLNEKGQYIKFIRANIGGWSEFTYNPNGSIAKWINAGREETSCSIDGGGCGSGDGTLGEYSDIPAIWRHTNAPDWFIFWLMQNMLVFPFERTGNIAGWGYMETNTDNYLTKLTSHDSVQIRKYEYILAK